MEKELSAVFTAYREYTAAKQEASRTIMPTLLGAALATAAVTAGASTPTVIAVAAAGLLTLLVLHASAVGRRVAARVRLESILDKKLSETRKRE